jgi:hypothetical protein
MSDDQEQNNFNKNLATTMLGVSAFTGLAGASPIQEYQDNLEPQSSYTQEVPPNPYYSKLAYGINDIDQLEGSMKNPEEEKQKRDHDLDIATMADHQSQISGSPEPEPSIIDDNNNNLELSNNHLANQLSDNQSNQMIIRPDYPLSSEVSQPDSIQQENNIDLANQLSESQTPNESLTKPEEKTETSI